jgi:putative addiction module CopG family antidote
MTVYFPPDLESFVEREVAIGNYADRNEVIEHALRLLRADREAATRGIQIGLDDVAAGRVQDLDEAFDDLRREFGVSKDA